MDQSLRLTFVFMSGLVAMATQTSPPTVDPYDLHVSAVELKEDDITKPVADIGQSLGMGISIEYVLSAETNAPPQPLRKISAAVPDGTAKQVLGRVTDLDPAYSLVRHGNMLNLVPKDVLADPAYVLNRKFSVIQIRKSSDVVDAVMQVVDQLPGKREQLAVLQLGGSLSFSEPWDTTFQNMTVREALDEIAQHRAQTQGWQLLGSGRFRYLVFHERLVPTPAQQP
jgi:hypothetical protein